MKLEIIDQIPAWLEGAPAKLVGIREDGAFGLVVAEPGGPPLKMPRPITISAAIDVARQVVRGEPRSLTAPLTMQDLAVSLLAIAARLGMMSIQLAAARGEEGEADGEGEAA